MASILLASRQRNHSISSPTILDNPAIPFSRVLHRIKYLYYQSYFEGTKVISSLILCAILTSSSWEQTLRAGHLPSGLSS